MEVASTRPQELNSINANKLDVIMPFLTDTIERLIAQFQNRVQAIIQNNYTSLHPSVYWKFRDAARQAIHYDSLGKPHKLPEIIFENVYPLYGQIDIKGSSEARNESTRKDLLHQLDSLLILIGKLLQGKSAMPDFSSVQYQLEAYSNELKFPIHAGTEQLITYYLESHVHGMLDQITGHPLSDSIIEYFKQTNKSDGEYHRYRRMYDETVNSINDKMISILDSRQSAAQQIFPHYFERFKTDGVDHSIYIGDSIAPAKNLTPVKLKKIRQWQLETLCEMEKAHFMLRNSLPYPLEVTTLLLIHSMPLSIRFRMDEKRFDVDGSYNARFEIIKKRIDKAYLKGTIKRLTEAGKLALVYSDNAEATEYTRFIKELNSKGFLNDEIENVDIEDLQGVTGLKALRVKFRR
ncbi:MAG TPA: hypothetical protein VK625_08685 [Flavitalea sp.]|nr:hypothetical protein [Flavitalea sp.]